MRKKNGNNGNNGNIEDLGNTKPNPKKRITPSKYWCFTFNNYKIEEMETLETMFIDFDIKYIMGEEIGKCGTAHLQGYIESDKKIRPIEKFGFKQIHWEKRRTSRLSNIKYCSKDGKYKTNMIVPRPLEKITIDDLHEQQREIVNLFGKPEDAKFGRDIYWFWENQGNWGKTILATYMVDNMNAICVSGKAADAKYIITQWVEKTGGGPDIVIMDIPRTKGSSFVSYEAIESIKNGCFVNTKYESGMVRFNRPHFIVFANEPPEMNRMSSDRWKIFNLSLDTLG